MESQEEKKPKFYEKNREAWNKYQREYKRRRYNEDPEYRFRIKEYNRQHRNAKKLQDDNLE
jgi:hypothetical protein